MNRFRFKRTVLHRGNVFLRCSNRSLSFARSMINWLFSLTIVRAFRTVWMGWARDSHNVGLSSNIAVIHKSGRWFQYHRAQNKLMYQTCLHTITRCFVLKYQHVYSCPATITLTKLVFVVFDECQQFSHTSPAAEYI